MDHDEFCQRKSRPRGARSCGIPNRPHWRVMQYSWIIGTPTEPNIDSITWKMPSGVALGVGNGTGIGGSVPSVSHHEDTIQ